MVENNDFNQIECAREVLGIEAQAITRMASRLDSAFTDAVHAILQSNGRLIVTGMGKSGHVGRKMAATLASTGTPAFFMHPAEAAHGDLGMVIAGDVVLAISNSGESDEVLALWPALKRKSVTLISMTGRAHSTMARLADIHLDAHIDAEACPLGLAPTASTTAQIALGDALAMTLLKARQFREHDFALSHPGGSLGRQLLLHVSDIMHAGGELPCVIRGTPLKDVLVEMSGKGLGMTAVCDPKGQLLGIYTDGDLRRTLDRTQNLTGIIIDDVMNDNPQTIKPEAMATEAIHQMKEMAITSLLVIDDQTMLVGALTMHDLLHAGVI